MAGCQVQWRLAGQKHTWEVKRSAFLSTELHATLALSKRTYPLSRVASVGVVTEPQQAPHFPFVAVVSSGVQRRFGGGLRNIGDAKRGCRLR